MSSQPPPPPHKPFRIPPPPKPSPWRRFRAAPLWAQILAWGATAFVALVIVGLAIGDPEADDQAADRPATTPAATTTAGKPARRRRRRGHHDSRGADARPGTGPRTGA